MSNKQTIFLSGLPRSGSTVLSNVLSQHPDIQATPSSPLCHIIENMRRMWSKDDFFKAQLDSNFEKIHKKLGNVLKNVIDTWNSDYIEKIVIEKNRSWLNCIEWLREIYPDFKMIVTIRDLRDIYASIEKAHRKTLFISFPDELEHNLADVRASQLFSDNGLIGRTVKAVYNIGDIPNITQHLLIWRYEDFLMSPKESINNVFNFMGIETVDIDFENIKQTTFENDSYYNMKFSHKIKSKLYHPESYSKSNISPRILNMILDRFVWFYETYYNDVINPNLIESNNSAQLSNQYDCNNPELGRNASHTKNPIDDADDTSALVKELEKLIEQETKLGQ